MCQQCGALAIKNRAEPIAGHQRTTCRGSWEIQLSQLQRIIGNKPWVNSEESWENKASSKGLWETSSELAAEDCGTHLFGDPGRGDRGKQ